jgi:hypothetical protein
MSSQHYEDTDHGVPAVLARVRDEVRELADTLWAARNGDELMDIVAEAEALKSAVDAVVLGAVRELDVTNAPKKFGWASTQDFVTSIAGGTKHTGPALVRLANAVDQPSMASVGEALRDGWLSTTKAHVIERAVDALPGSAGLRAKGVQSLLGEAKALDATELKKVANRLLSIIDPSGDERRDEKALARLERAAHLSRFLTVADDGAGGAWIKGRCSSEDAALVKATLVPLAAPAPSDGPVCDPDACTIPGCGHDGRDPRDHGARMLDALIEACRRLQTAEVLPQCHGATPRVTVTIDLEDLRNQSGFGTAETGEQLSATAVRQICCDSHVIPAVLGATSDVLDVGRQQRLVSAAIWRALVARDLHCRFKGCTRPPIMCHAHHLVHWADGGETSLKNLILLCGHHHRLIHSGPWQIRRTGPRDFAFDPPPGVRRLICGRPPPAD